MEKPDEIKYILDQVNIEIDHIRAWPTKIMAFYVAINFGIISVIIALQKFDTPVLLPFYIKTAIAIVIVFITLRILRTLWNLNTNYIIQRNLQIDLQNKIFNKDKQKEYNLPSFWFKKKEGCSCIKYPGWLIYVYFLILILCLMIIGIFTIG